MLSVTVLCVCACVAAGHPGIVCAVAAYLDTKNFVLDEKEFLDVIIPATQRYVNNDA